MVAMMLLQERRVVSGGGAAGQSTHMKPKLAKIQEKRMVKQRKVPKTEKKTAGGLGRGGRGEWASLTDLAEEKGDGGED